MIILLSIQIAKILIIHWILQWFASIAQMFRWLKLLGLVCIVLVAIISGTSEDIAREPRSIRFNRHAFPRHPDHTTGGLCLPSADHIYVYIYIYTRIFARASRALDSPWPMTLNTTMSLTRRVPRHTEEAALSRKKTSRENALPIPKAAVPKMTHLQNERITEHWNSIHART